MIRPASTSTMSFLALALVTLLLAEPLAARTVKLAFLRVGDVYKLPRRMDVAVLRA